MPKIGRQTPTQEVVLPYKATKGDEAIEFYNSSGRHAQEWQQSLIYDILAYNDDGLWVHTKYGYAVPRRNGKNEIVAIREMYGLKTGEHLLHTAHRTTTSHSAWERLVRLLNAAGYQEVKRVKKEEHYQHAFVSTAQYGLEQIKILDEGGGVINFRTRSSKGGLGEGYDLLVIDEAQEYTDDQESALKYVVTDSKNPQTLFCGTPPTAVSSGTVFANMRKNVLAGGALNSGWAEWSVETESDPRNKDLWYETNPSLGVIFTERSVADEIGSDKTDFNIQRLGLWIKYNQKSAISKNEWELLKVDRIPTFKGKLFVGIKFGHDGMNATMSIAVRTTDDKIYVETIDCRSLRDGIAWIIPFLQTADIKTVVADGSNGVQILQENMKAVKLKAPIVPKVPEIITAGSMFEQAVFGGTICHNDQPSLTQAISNCEHRAIGSNGGFGYKSIKDGIDIGLVDSVVLAHWACATTKEKKVQHISY